MTESNIVTVYTDGACRGNPGPGGWGVILCYGKHEKTLHGFERETTNNRMELMAAIKALEALKRSCRVSLTTDSQYVRRGITEWINTWQRNGWRTADRKPVKNAELWRELYELSQKHRIEWHWVKGHSGDPHNERVDALANLAIDEGLGTHSK